MNSGTLSIPNRPGEDRPPQFRWNGTPADVLHGDGSWSPPGAGGSHAASHQNNGGDELNVAGLSGVLADPQTPAAHTHDWADITGEPALIVEGDPRLTDARAPTSHTHPQSEITNLVTDLAGKEPANANIQSHIASAHAPANAQANADITKGEIEAKLTGVISSHSHAGGGGINTLRTTSNQTINGGAGVFVDITGLTFPVVSGVDYAFDFYITFQSAATATGWKAGVNCPAGALDFWAGSQTIANGAAGVATHTERHNTVRDDMTLLTATVTQAVDLNVRITGRYCCTANGTFAARFANELASNTQIVVQKGSFGTWF